MNYKQFVMQHGIRMVATLTERNPNMTDDGDWTRTATHWRCEFRKGRRKLVTYFSQGSAHTREPTVVDVLQCLASDASTIEYTDGFEDWAHDLGYDPDSRKAERSYHQCLDQTQHLKRFLDDGAQYGDVFKALLECREDA